MKISRLAKGQRATPKWVAERMADRPPWRCRTPDEQEWFIEFVIADLTLRTIVHGGATAKSFRARAVEPRSPDGRKKRWIERAFADAEAGARAVPIIREIFEDYWVEGRDAGRVYRGHDPSAEMIAAKYAGVSVDDIERVLKRNKTKRPSAE